MLLKLVQFHLMAYSGNKTSVNTGMVFALPLGKQLDNKENKEEESWVASSR